MLTQIVSEIVRNILSKSFADSNFTLETPPDARFGDLACNVALILAKKLGKNPRELAEELSAKLSENELIEKVEVAGPGFLNIFLKPNIFQRTLENIEKLSRDFSKSDSGKNEKVLLEFISANPTGPLTIANGRGGFGGDVLARVMERAGYVVSREYYVNDAGNQVELLGKSIQKVSGVRFPSFAKATEGRQESGEVQGQRSEVKDEEEELYQGEYIKELAEKHSDKITDDSFETGRIFAKILLDEEVKPAVEKMGVKFSTWFSEYELRESGGIEETYKFLEEKGLTYEKDGALWLKTSEFGDDKDRVIRKSEDQGGGPTYVLPDLMYHKSKFERGFTKLIDILGADHHGYVPRLKIGVKALGFGEVEVIITQLVKLFREGKEVRMSKRAGNFELMNDLIAEVGADAARWFFIMRDWNTHLNFDLDLAKKHSNDNPVYYVQYAHTRMAAIMQNAVRPRSPQAKLKMQNIDWKDGDLKLLVEPGEFNLIKKMAELPELVQEISKTYAVHQLTTYARELAEAFHKFYEACRVIDEENLDLTKARLRLVATVKEVLRIVLEDLVGVSAPSKM